MRSCSYDPIGQLQVVDSSLAWQDRGYLYDATWNLNYRTNSGVLVTAYQVDSRNQLTSAGSQSCSYDDNGNLVQASTGSSLTAYVYDDENRLVRITNGPPASPPPQVAPMRPSPLPGWRTDLVYDGLGRLRIRHEYSNTVNGWWLDGTTLYIYAGNRVIQERNGSLVPTVSYTRGSDLSGSLEGAGGIGGLLARSTGNGSTWTSHAYYHADGNGNITALVDGTQSVVAAYRYDPFGNPLAKTGTLADGNVYRFSSKELHAKSGLYYYLYRFYDPNLQRWINRDPLGEPGFELTKSGGPSLFQDGPNLYAFVDNDPLSYVDPLGQSIFDDLDDPSSKNEQDDRQITECERAKKRQECLDECDKEKDEDDDFCRSLPNRTKMDKRKREYCWRMAQERHARCIGECNKQWN